MHPAWRMPESPHRQPHGRGDLPGAVTTRAQDMDGNGVISPLQKSVLTRNGPRHAIGGVIAVDRMLQQTAKTVSPTLMGLLLLWTDVSAVFWVLGPLAAASGFMVFRFSSMARATIALLVSFLASPSASAITGQTYNIDGGQTMD